METVVFALFLTLALVLFAVVVAGAAGVYRKYCALQEERLALRSAPVQIVLIRQSEGEVKLGYVVRSSQRLRMRGGRR